MSPAHISPPPFLLAGEGSFTDRRGHAHRSLGRAREWSEDVHRGQGNERDKERRKERRQCRVDGKEVSRRRVRERAGSDASSEGSGSEHGAIGGWRVGARSKSKTRAKLGDDQFTPQPPASRSATNDTHSPSPLSATSSAALSIDDIIRKHSAGIDGALTAAKQRARAELGLRPGEVSPTRTIPDPSTEVKGRFAEMERTESRESRESTVEGSERSLEMEIQAGTPTTQRWEYEQPGALNGRTRFEAGGSPSLTSTTTSSSGGTSVRVGAGHQPLHDLDRQPSPSSTQQGPRSPPLLRVTTSEQPPTASPSTESHEDNSMALYLRSAHLNILLHLPRPSPLPPLRVSFAEVGSPTGSPVLVFLGLGCVRYLIALYDELAAAYGLRLICIDRWGLGKTDMVETSDRGLMEWAKVVEGVMREIKVERFHVLAHSAGAPYAMAVARRYPEKILGRLHLLAPWVNADVDGGYKWLKWIPNGVIKTATAADWRLQSYFLGKAPTLNYKPVENVPIPLPVSRPPVSASTSRQSLDSGMSGHTSTLPASLSRTSSIARRASRIIRPQSSYGSALPTRSSLSTAPSHGAPTGDPVESAPGVKNFRSMAALRSNSSPASVTTSTTSLGTPSSRSSVLLRTPDQAEITANDIDFVLSEGFDTFALDLKMGLPSPSTPTRTSSVLSLSTLTSRSTPSPTGTPSPAPPRPKPPSGPSLTLALTQSSHAECEPGTTADLLSIVLQRDSKPWGFRYEDVEAKCKVWYGKEDDKISEKGMRWMERTMGAEVRVVKGEGHNLMTSAGIMCEAFESLARDARKERD